ncbi:MAG: hypothetical protein AAFU63_11420 [Pseudomonadota bacterium]
MTDLLNIIACLLTIAFGLFGFLAPRYTRAPPSIWRPPTVTWG